MGKLFDMQLLVRGGKAKATFFATSTLTMRR